MENLKVIVKRDQREVRVNGRNKLMPTGTYTCSVSFDNKMLVSTKRGTIKENDYKLVCHENNLPENINEIEIKNPNVQFFKGLRPDGTRYFYCSIHLYKMYDYSKEKDVDCIRTIWFNNQELNLLAQKGFKIEFVEKSLSDAELKEMIGDSSVNAE